MSFWKLSNSIRSITKKSFFGEQTTRSGTLRFPFFTQVLRHGHATQEPLSPSLAVRDVELFVLRGWFPTFYSLGRFLRKQIPLGPKKDLTFHGCIRNLSVLLRTSLDLPLSWTLIGIPRSILRFPFIRVCHYMCVCTKGAIEKWSDWGSSKLKCIFASCH